MTDFCSGSIPGCPQTFSWDLGRRWPKEAALPPIQQTIFNSTHTMESAAKHIETNTIIRLPSGKPAMFDRKNLMAIYCSEDENLVGKKVRADEVFEIIANPYQMAREWLFKLNAQLMEMESADLDI